MPETAQVADGALTMQDGSRAQPLLPETQLQLEVDQPELVQLRLEQGGARFDVVRNLGRRFQVRTDSVTVEVLGTVFTVHHEGDEQIRVAVVEGRVRVSWEGQTPGQTELATGEAGTFPREAPGGSPAPLAQPSQPQESASRKAATKLERRVAGARWQRLAQAHDFEGAFRALVDAGGTKAVRDVPNELLLAADVARRSGHPAESAVVLERLLAKYSHDPRASVAAFTLGRVYDGLSRPAQAATAFRRSRTLSPDGPLSEDALAREADAWARSGRGLEAKAAAANYLRVHPLGVHSSRMKELAR